MAVEDSVAQDRLLAFIERLERLIDEKNSIGDDIKEVKAEAKGDGFDVGILNKIIKIRAMDPSKRMEQAALLELYMSAIGMSSEPHEY